MEKVTVTVGAQAQADSLSPSVSVTPPAQPASGPGSTGPTPSSAPRSSGPPPQFRSHRQSYNGPPMGGGYYGNNSRGRARSASNREKRLSSGPSLNAGLDPTQYSAPAYVDPNVYPMSGYIYRVGPEATTPDPLVMPSSSSSSSTPPVDNSTVPPIGPYQGTPPTYPPANAQFRYPNGMYYPSGLPPTNPQNNGTKFYGYPQFHPAVYGNPYPPANSFTTNQTVPTSGTTDSYPGYMDPPATQPFSAGQAIVAGSPAPGSASQPTGSPFYRAPSPSGAHTSYVSSPVPQTSSGQSGNNTASMAVAGGPTMLPILPPSPVPTYGLQHKASNASIASASGSESSSRGKFNPSHGYSGYGGENVYQSPQTPGRGAYYPRPQPHYPSPSVSGNGVLLPLGVFSPQSIPPGAPSSATPIRETRPPSLPMPSTPNPGSAPGDRSPDSFVGSTSRRESGASTIESSVPDSAMLTPRGSISELGVSKTNLYVRGLGSSATDDWLYNLCKAYGKISSSKAIIDLTTKECKGYGFVMYETDEEAKAAMAALIKDGFQVSFARESFNAKLKNLHDAESTNIYVSNLPLDMDEQGMLQLFAPHKVSSNKILRDQSHKSRGVGFARMETREAASAVIQALNGRIPEGSTQPLQVRFADSEGQKKLKQQHLYNAQHHHHHHGVYSPMGHPPSHPSLGSGPSVPMSPYQSSGGQPSARRRLFRHSFGSASSGSGIPPVSPSGLPPASPGGLAPPQISDEVASSAGGSQIGEEEVVDVESVVEGEAAAVDTSTASAPAAAGAATEAVVPPATAGVYGMVPYYDGSYMQGGILYAPGPVYPSGPMPMIYPFYGYQPPGGMAQTGPTAVAQPSSQTLPPHPSMGYPPPVPHAYNSGQPPLPPHARGPYSPHPPPHMAGYPGIMVPTPQGYSSTYTTYHPNMMGAPQMLGSQPQSQHQQTHHQHPQTSTLGSSAYAVEQEQSSGVAASAAESTTGAVASAAVPSGVVGGSDPKLSAPTAVVDEVAIGIEKVSLD